LKLKYRVGTKGSVLENLTVDLSRYAIYCDFLCLNVTFVVATKVKSSLIQKKCCAQLHTYNKSLVFFI
jgi:hypothetical protein